MKEAKNNEGATHVKPDMVNHPPHYTWLRDLAGVEVIDITRHMNFNLGNAVKYILRAGRKDPDKQIEDLRKAEFYIKDEIRRLENSAVGSVTDSDELRSLRERLTKKLDETISVRDGKPQLGIDFYKLSGECKALQSVIALITPDKK